MPIPTNNTPAGNPVDNSRTASSTAHVIDLPGRYFGSIGYYAARAAAGTSARIATDTLFDKRAKAWHRTTIADKDGICTLTVPIIKPHGITRATWQDVMLSPHGQWWHVHRVTLESAYGRSPFFEYYIDRLLPFLQSDALDCWPTLTAYLQAIDAEICKILLIPSPQYPTLTPSKINSLLTLTSPSTHTSITSPSPLIHSTPPTRSPLSSPTDIILEPYYQVRAATLGFIPNLSILDLIFNLGSTAPLYLHRLLSNYD